MQYNDGVFQINCYSEAITHGRKAVHQDLYVSPRVCNKIAVIRIKEITYIHTDLSTFGGRFVMEVRF